MARDDQNHTVAIESEPLKAEIKTASNQVKERLQFPVSPCYVYRSLLVMNVCD